MKPWIVSVSVEVDDGEPNLLYRVKTTNERHARETAISMLNRAQKNGYPAERLLCNMHEDGER